MKTTLGIGLPSACLGMAWTIALSATGLSAADETQSSRTASGSGSGAAEAAVGAAPDLAAWAVQPTTGPEGRPLPLTGSWMAEGIFGPERFVQLIRQGHHVLPTFVGVSMRPVRAYVGGDERQQARIEQEIETYYRPTLEFAREHRLPIAFREWNWSSMPPQFQRLSAQFRQEDVSLEDDVRVVIDGKPTDAADPFGPVELWRQWGEFWFGNPLMRRIQQIYPNPPLVIFLDNNEGPAVRSAGAIPDDYPRLVAFLGGKRPEDRRAKEHAIGEGYRQRYAAMFEAARGAMIEPAWRRNVKFVAYNNLWDTGYIGQGGRPRPGIGFEPDEGWTQWRINDGGMPEIYDNDWQPGKTDHTPWSPQTEAMNYYAAQGRLYEQEPDYYWAAITWDGGRVANAWRGRRSASKTFTYATRGQRWDFARYEGWVQFALWTTRARSYREFRAPAHAEHAYDEGAFMAMVRSVDRPWKNETLREFWRFGKLVPNRDEKPWFNELDNDHPQWVRDLERWYLLTCDANPPRDEWTGDTKLRVFAQALVLGEKPGRRWLIYAHAPLGAVAGPAVRLPGFGEVQLESVPKSGSFFLVCEEDRSVKPVLHGGPDELSLESDRRWAATGEPVCFEAEVAHAPGRQFAGFTWSFGDGTTVQQKRLAAVEHSFAEPGEYVVTIEGRLADGGCLREQAAVFVGQPPADSVVYALSLREPFEWQGPWDAVDGEPARLVTYRHLPNAGRAPAPALSGGRFVEDPQRGRVLELGGPQDAIWLARNRDTVMEPEGHPNQTISLWFKAEDTEKRQVLYAQGHHLVGFNIYLHEGRIHAGSWAPVEGQIFDWFPVPGRSFEGHWLSAGGIEPGRWYHVALVLREATTQVLPDKQHLYLDGELVDRGPGVRIPRQYGVARVGLGPIGTDLLMRFHDGESDDRKVAKFCGRLSDFRLTHDSTTVSPNNETASNHK